MRLLLALVFALTLAACDSGSDTPDGASAIAGAYVGTFSRTSGTTTSTSYPARLSITNPAADQFDFLLLLDISPQGSSTFRGRGEVSGNAVTLTLSDGTQLGYTGITGTVGAGETAGSRRITLQGGRGDAYLLQSVAG